MIRVSFFWTLINFDRFSNQEWPEQGYNPDHWLVVCRRIPICSFHWRQRWIWQHTNKNFDQLIGFSNREREMRNKYNIFPFIHIVLWIYTGCKADPDPASVLRIRDVYPGSASKNLSILTQKIVSKLSEIWSRLLIPDPGDPNFLPIPDPGVIKAPYPGSATLSSILVWCGSSKT